MGTQYNDNTSAEIAQSGCKGSNNYGINKVMFIFSLKIVSRVAQLPKIVYF